MNKKEIFWEYFRTFLLTIISIFICVMLLLVIVQQQVFQELDSKKLEDDSFEYYMIGLLIEKNKYLEAKHPDNYKINLKLGILYEIYKDFKNSEENYKFAIAKAPYYEYKPSYKLANLYLRQDRLEESQKIMDDIKEKPDKILIEYKANIYKLLGDKYYSKADYEDAIEHYEKALSYYEIIKFDKEIDYVKNSLASSYVYLAEDFLNKMQVEEAIISLEMANSIVDAPILKYRLALLLMKNQPYAAYDLFEEIFKQEPSILNYDEYYKFLSQLEKKSDEEGDTSQAELYRYKMKKVKAYFKQNVLSVDDVSVEDAMGRIKLNYWAKKYNIDLQFKLKNNDKENIDSLFINVVFKDNDYVIDNITKQVVDPKSILGTNLYTSTIELKTTKKQNNFDLPPKEINVEIYASKKEKSYKVLLKTFTIKEKIKRKKLNRFIMKITSFFPSF